MVAKLVAFLTSFIVLFFTFSCNKKELIAHQPPPLFDSIPAVARVTPEIISASGIADSKANKGYLWVQEDGDHPNQLYLLSYDGLVQKTVFLHNATNRDWEDMAMAGNDIYMADIGDNFKSYSEYTIYYFKEPSLTTDTVRNIKAIKFKYQDGAQNAEAFLIDPLSKDIYIFNKQDSFSKIYKIAHPYKQGMNTAVFIGSLPYPGVVSAALSADGKEIVLKTYAQLYYYTRDKKETIEQALKKSYMLLPYKVEPQGEAVTFSNAGAGYFTLSEKSFFDKVELFFYKRN